MKITRIDHDMHGASYFFEHELELCAGSFTPLSPAGYFKTSQLPTDIVLMMHHPAGYEDEWQTALQPDNGDCLTETIAILDYNDFSVPDAGLLGNRGMAQRQPVVMMDIIERFH